MLTSISKNCVDTIQGRCKKLPNYRAIECAFEDKNGQQFDFSQLAKEKFNWEAAGTGLQMSRT